jgi:putative ABC transport system substrate-binding protein
MRRREFISLAGGAAAAWPVAAKAQQPGKVPRIGFLWPGTAAENVNRLAGFRQGLRDLGYEQGTNIIIEDRWAEGNYERLQGLVSELVRSNVDVIVTGGTPGSLVAKRATTIIPIVMANVGDPVAAGLVASVARPGGNITGQSSFSPELYAKRIELLKEVQPRITEVVAILFNPDNAATRAELQTMETAAQLINVGLQQFPVRAPNELESAFDRMVERHMEAVGISDDGMLNANLGAIAALTTKRRLLSIGNLELAQAGGLIGYGINYFATYRRAAAFVDKILKGTKPADLPIEQATRFQFVLNLKTAKALGLDVPTATLLRADKVIE